MALRIDSLSKQGTSWETGKSRYTTIARAQFSNGILHQDESQIDTKDIPEARSYNYASESIPVPKRLAVSKIRTFVSNPGPGRSTQIAELPTGTQQPELRLSYPAYGLPSPLVANFSSLGLNLLYPWQAACLQKAGSRNFVYSASTGAGKSLVADVLMLKKVLETGCRAIVVLPYVALVQEKTKWLRKVVAGLEKNVEQSMPGAFHGGSRSDRAIRVLPFFGGSKLRATLEDADIAVATIERANGLINQAIEDARIEDLGVVVIDELHMIADAARGFLLEPLVSKVLSLEQHISILGMSATLSNVGDLATWLDAGWYESDYKAVPVAEYVVHENKIYPAGTVLSDLTPNKGSSQGNKPKAIRAIEPSREPELSQAKHNATVALAMETVLAGYGVLVFCSSRHGCQITAELIARACPVPRSNMAEQRKEVLDNLRSLMNLELDPTLEVTIPWGVGFHHAGLTTEEKDIIADAFDQGILQVLVATSSLAAGINLPARRVILQEARQGRDFIGPAMLLQMRGRAGRKGKDTIGESFVCCNSTDLAEVSELLEMDLPPVTSCLTAEQRGIKRPLLEVIAIRLANHEQGIEGYVRKTLLYHTMERGALQEMCIKALGELIDEAMVEVHGDEYEATPLGKAIVSAGLELESGVFLYEEIKNAMKHFVMDSDLHIIYLFSPVNLDTVISFPAFLNELDNLSLSDLRVLEYTGVNPKRIAELAVAGSKDVRLPEATTAEIHTARVYRRLYVALQLRALCSEIPIGDVAKRFSVSRGAVQSLAQSTQAFAASMISFCQRLGFGMLASLLEYWVDRLRAGARADLLDLARVPFIKSVTARILMDHGYRNLRAVAEASVDDLAEVLLLAQPRKRRRMPEEEEGYIKKMKLRAEIVIAQAQKLWERELISTMAEDI